MDDLGPGADLFGHSYGCVVALEAARRTTHVRRLVLYEPWIGRYSDGLIEEREGLVASGDREAVTTTILRRRRGMTDTELERYRAHPSWESVVALAEVKAREARCVTAPASLVRAPARSTHRRASSATRGLGPRDRPHCVGGSLGGRQPGQRRWLEYELHASAVSSRWSVS